MPFGDMNPFLKKNLVNEVTSPLKDNCSCLRILVEMFLRLSGISQVWTWKYPIPAKTMLYQDT